MDPRDSRYKSPELRNQKKRLAMQSELTTFLCDPRHTMMPSEIFKIERRDNYICGFYLITWLEGAQKDIIAPYGSIDSQSYIDMLFEAERQILEDKESSIGKPIPVILDQYRDCSIVCSIIDMETLSDEARNLVETQCGDAIKRIADPHVFENEERSFRRFW